MRDGMDTVYEIFEATDGLVLGTPVYYNSVSSQMKLMIDRSYCLAKAGLDFPSAGFHPFGGDQDAGRPQNRIHIVTWLQRELAGIPGTVRARAPKSQRR